jgi:hypothetical protein
MDFIGRQMQTSDVGTRYSLAVCLLDGPSGLFN